MRRIPRSALILSAFVLQTGAAGAQTAAVNRTAVQAQIVANEKAISDAFAKGDVKAFHALVAPDGYSVDATGIMKMGPDVDKMMADYKETSSTIDSSQFYWLNDATVVHMYRWSGKATFKGAPAPSPVWSSTVWMNKGGKWLAMFHQESVAMAMPPVAPKPVPAKK
jgi:hypothetical protein